MMRDGCSRRAAASASSLLHTDNCSPWLKNHLGLSPITNNVLQQTHSRPPRVTPKTRSGSDLVCRSKSRDIQRQHTSPTVRTQKSIRHQKDLSSVETLPRTRPALEKALEVLRDENVIVRLMTAGSESHPHSADLACSNHNRNQQLRLQQNESEPPTKADDVKENSKKRLLQQSRDLSEGAVTQSATVETTVETFQLPPHVSLLSNQLQEHVENVQQTDGFVDDLPQKTEAETGAIGDSKQTLIETTSVSDGTSGQTAFCRLNDVIDGFVQQPSQHIERTDSNVDMAPSAQSYDVIDNVIKLSNSEVVTPLKADTGGQVNAIYSASSLAGVSESDETVTKKDRIGGYCDDNVVQSADSIEQSATAFSSQTSAPSPPASAAAADQQIAATTDDATFTIAGKGQGHVWFDDRANIIHVYRVNSPDAIGTLPSLDVELRSMTSSSIEQTVVIRDAADTAVETPAPHPAAISADNLSRDSDNQIDCVYSAERTIAADVLTRAF